MIWGYFFFWKPPYEPWAIVFFWAGHLVADGFFCLTNQLPGAEEWQFCEHFPGCFVRKTQPLDIVKKNLRTNSYRIFQEMILNSIFVCFWRVEHLQFPWSVIFHGSNYSAWNVHASIPGKRQTSDWSWNLNCLKVHPNQFFIGSTAPFKPNWMGIHLFQEVELQHKLPTTGDSQGRTSSTSGNSPMPVRRCGFNVGEFLMSGL